MIFQTLAALLPVDRHMTLANSFNLLDILYFMCNEDSSHTYPIRYEIQAFNEMLCEKHPAHA